MPITGAFGILTLILILAVETILVMMLALTARLRPRLMI